MEKNAKTININRTLWFSINWKYWPGAELTDESRDGSGGLIKANSEASLRPWKGGLLLDKGFDVSLTTLTALPGSRIVGDGVIKHDVTVNAGIVAPCNDPDTGRITFDGDYTQTGAGSLLLDLGTETASEMIAVTNDVTVDGSLQLTARSDFAPTPYSSYTLVDNQGEEPVSGTFDGRPHGAVIHLAGYRFLLTYKGGDGNDIVLVPPAAVSGSVWDDLNRNGGWASPEVGFSGITVTLFDADGVPLATSATDGQGGYRFDDTFTAQLTVGPSGGPPAGGTVTFYVGGFAVATTAVSSGVATYTTATLTAGSHHIAAVYGGDETYPGGAEDSLTQVVQKRTSNLTVGSYIPPPGQSTIAIDCTVVGMTVLPPTGTVEFLIDGQLVGSAQLTLVNGVASTSVTVPRPASGTHWFTVTYLGDDHYHLATITFAAIVP